MKKACEWHKDDDPIEIDDEGLGFPGCPECGRLIATKDCRGCGKTFLDWEYSGWDDIVAGPCGTSSGDFCCTHCAPFIEAEWERQEEEDAYEFEYGED